MMFSFSFLEACGAATATGDTTAVTLFLLGTADSGFGEGAAFCSAGLGGAGEGDCLSSFFLYGEYLRLKDSGSVFGYSTI